MANLTRAEGNRFIEALNARGLCACAVRRQLAQMDVPGPYLPCERDERPPLRCGYCPDAALYWVEWTTIGRPKGAPVCQGHLNRVDRPDNFGVSPKVVPIVDSAGPGDDDDPYMYGTGVRRRQA
jgi:hypothetical protein